MQPCVQCASVTIVSRLPREGNRAVEQWEPVNEAHALIRVSATDPDAREWITAGLLLSEDTARSKGIHAESGALVILFPTAASRQ